MKKATIWKRWSGLDFTNPVGTGRVWDVCPCLGWSCVCGIGVSGCVAWSRVWQSRVMLFMCVLWVCIFWRCQVHVSMYYSRRTPAHLRCTHCLILLHHIDICFLTCIYLLQISKIQTFLGVVVGPGLVTTSSTFWVQINIFCSMWDKYLIFTNLISFTLWYRMSQYVRFHVTLVENTLLYIHTFSWCICVSFLADSCLYCIKSNFANCQ